MAQSKPNWETVPPRDWEEEQALRIGNEIKRLRKKRSAQWLSDRTRELGCLVTRAVISDLEVGRRRYVTVAELIILARALDTAPLALLYPFPYYGDRSVQVLPGQPDVEKIFAVQWFSGIPGLYLHSLGLSDVDQINYGSQLQGLRRARIVFALQDKLLEADGRRRACIDNAQRNGRSPELDAKIDDVDADIRYLRGRITEELALGDRDLYGEHLDQFYGEYVSKDNGG